MTRTEQDLWRVLRSAGDAAGYPSRALTRFEVITANGVSDVEYVLAPYHGWIELKVSPTQRDDSLLRTGAPFTADQCQWLVSHHAPSHYMRSWLLIGMYSQRAWGDLILVPAPRTPRFMTGELTLAQVRQRAAVIARDMAEIIWALTTEGTDDGKYYA